MTLPRFLLRLALACALGLAPSARAVIFYSTGHPGYNNTAPGGTLTNSGWQHVGLWGAFVGTVVGPRHFLTAQHVGGQVGDPFLFQGRTYTALAFEDDAQTDLRLVRVCATLPGPAAPLYTNFNETSKSLVLMGRGTQRGAEIRVGGVLKGWEWGLADTALRWGENRVTGLIPAGVTNFLMANFDATGGTNEAHLSVGDSGGPVFIKEGTAWKLAGINYAVDGPFNTTNTGSGFNAAVFDRGGLHEFNDATQTWVPVLDQPGNLPSAFYATRVATRVPWIQGVLAAAVPPDPAPVLESAPALGGAFTPESSASVNPSLRTITVPSWGGPRRFYRLSGCGPYRILSVTVSGPDVVLAYE